MRRLLIDLPAALDGDDRYDLAVRSHSPAKEDLLLAALESHCRCQVTREDRAREVYVMTAPHGAGPSLVADPSGEGIGAVSLERVMASGDPAADHVWTALSGQTSIAQLCDILQMALGRPVVDEILAGGYQMALAFPATDAAGIMAVVRDTLGLVLTPEIRTLPMLIVRAR